MIDGLHTDAGRYMDLVGRFELPAGRFFTPTSGFWEKLKIILAEYPGVTLIDCGCGNGALIDEAAQHDIKMDGVDLCVRSDMNTRVRLIDATILRWSSSVWPIICRPSHGGWAETIVKQARKSPGAHAIYVGLPSNYKRDVPGLGMKVVARNIGESKETMYMT